MCIDSFVFNFSNASIKILRFSNKDKFVYILFVLSEENKWFAEGFRLLHRTGRGEVSEHPRW
jgi:hypothetical protein